MLIVRMMEYKKRINIQQNVHLGVVCEKKLEWVRHGGGSLCGGTMSPRWWCSRCRENPRLTRSFQDVRRNDNQLSGDIWDNQHRVQMSARSKSLIIMAMMPAGGRRRWDNVQRIEHHLTEVALARQRGSRNFPASRAFYNILVKSISPEKY